MQRYLLWMTVPGMIVGGILSDLTHPVIAIVGMIAFIVLGALIWIRLDL